MRKGAALGFLFVVGVILVWTGITGRTGTVLAAVLSPDQVLIKK